MSSKDTQDGSEVQLTLTGPRAKAALLVLLMGLRVLVFLAGVGVGAFLR